MRTPCLTGFAGTRKDRRTAIRLMTVMTLVGLPLSSRTRADEPPASLIARALVRSGYCDDHTPRRSLAWVQLIPQLRLRAMMQQSQEPRRASIEGLGIVELIWPLTRSAALDGVAAARELRQREAARDSLVARIGAAWRRRRQAQDRADDLASDEADAELEALTGDDEERR
jgi:hypothetical protein